MWAAGARGTTVPVWLVPGETGGTGTSSQSGMMRHLSCFVAWRAERWVGPWDGGEGEEQPTDKEHQPIVVSPDPTNTHQSASGQPHMVVHNLSRDRSTLPATQVFSHRKAPHHTGMQLPSTWNTTSQVVHRRPPPPPSLIAGFQLRKVQLPHASPTQGTRPTSAPPRPQPDGRPAQGAPFFKVRQARLYAGLSDTVGVKAKPTISAQVVRPREAAVEPTSPTSPTSSAGAIGSKGRPSYTLLMDEVQALRETNEKLVVRNASLERTSVPEGSLRDDALVATAPAAALAPSTIREAAYEPYTLLERDALMAERDALLREVDALRGAAAEAAARDNDGRDAEIARLQRECERQRNQIRDMQAEAEAQARRAHDGGASVGAKLYADEALALERTTQRALSQRQMLGLLVLGFSKGAMTRSVSH